MRQGGSLAGPLGAEPPPVPDLPLPYADAGTAACGSGGDDGGMTWVIF